MARRTNKKGKKDPTDFSYLLVKPTDETEGNESVDNDEKENEE